MKLLVLGKNCYPAKFFFNEIYQIKSDKIKIITFQKKIDTQDILTLDNKLFYEKYFSDIDNHLDVSLNFIHIHNNDFNLEIKINYELCIKFKYVFNYKNILKNIYLSTVNSYQKATTSYGKSKFACEEIYRSLSNSIIVRPSTIIDIDYSKNLIVGGKKGQSLNFLNKIIKKSIFIPVPGLGKYLQTICFGKDLAKFLNLIIISNDFDNKTINFFSGEMISYNKFLDINFRLQKKKRIKLIIPIFFISFLILLLNKIFRLKISRKNIDNLTNQRIEFNNITKIEKKINLKKLDIDLKS